MRFPDKVHLGWNEFMRFPDKVHVSFPYSNCSQMRQHHSVKQPIRIETLPQHFERYTTQLTRTLVQQQLHEQQFSDWTCLHDTIRNDEYSVEGSL